MSERERRRKARKNGHAELRGRWEEEFLVPIRGSVREVVEGMLGTPDREVALIDAIMNRVRASLEQKFTEVFNESHFDYLTGVCSIRMFRLFVTQDLLPRMRRARLADGTYPVYGSIAMIDFDHFKQINEKFGHSGGDRVLAEFGRVMKTLFRNGDTIARLGGDEFIVVARGISGEDMTRRLEFARSHFLCKPIGLLCLSSEQDETLKFSFTYDVQEISDPHKVESAIGMADRGVLRRKDDRRRKED